MKIYQKSALGILFLTIILYCLPVYSASTGTSDGSLSISGTVRDETGNGFPGVYVREKGTANGAITDIAGNYTVKVTDGNATLVFTFIGYKTQEVQLNGRLIIDITMQPEVAQLDEVVLVGYGTQKKTTVSGSVAQVNGQEVSRSPALNVTNSLAGSIPGLVTVGQSGEPGEDYATLYIRGQSTLNDNSPLIVIDGVPNRSLERIDPATIENISVLKDASAAIYGSQAANGVILVTTKRGNAEKLQFTASYTMGWTRPTRIPELTNSAEFATLANEVNYYDNRPAVYTPEQIEAFRSGSDPWRYPNTNWFKEVLKPWSMQGNANITMSGGNEKIRSFVSISSRNQDGFFKNSASKYKQHDIRANIDHKINKYIDFSVDAGLRVEQRTSPTAWSPAIFLNLMTALPMQVARWPNGLPGPPLDPSNQVNPVVQATPDGGVAEGENYVFNVNSKLLVKIPGIEGLTLTATGALDRGLNYNKSFSKHYQLYQWDRVTVDADNLPVLESNGFGESNLQQSLTINKEYVVNGFLTYQRKFDDHNLNIVTGMELIQNNYFWFTAERRNFTLNYPDELNFGDEDKQYASGSNPGINRWKNYFGRFNYTLKDRYIAEFVWRYQGSSKFSPSTRWGFFPGISLAYRIAEEPFWKDLPFAGFIPYMKIRASWGKTGNDLIPAYQFYSLYEQSWRNFISGNGTTYPVYGESLAGNSKAQWEEANQFNVGTDMGFLNNKLTFTFDYFNNLRTKILISQAASIPDMTGTSDKLPLINLGKVRNQGFDFELLWRDNDHELDYSVAFNGLWAKNRVLFFDEAEGMLPWQKQTGHPMKSGIFYIADGIFHTQEELDQYPHMNNARTGDVRFKDINDDGKINGDDMKRIYKNVVPTISGGITVKLMYKSFDLALLVQGQAGGIKYIQYMGSKTGSNYMKDFYDNRWTEDNPYADYPRTFNRNDEYWVSSENANTFWLRKTDFIRLRNFELGYNLSQKIAGKLGLTGCRIHAGGYNLVTWTPDMRDFDPELEAKGDGMAGEGYPLQKMLTAGLSITF
ncbi:MAG TPA: TonB-dependent receptor [Bacteroidales bacterium]|nr:TonB-dependent receptor [Bacteroidales bacterium]